MMRYFQNLARTFNDPRFYSLTRLAQGWNVIVAHHRKNGIPHEFIGEHLEEVIGRVVAVLDTEILEGRPK